MGKENFTIYKDIFTLRLISESFEEYLVSYEYHYFLTLKTWETGNAHWPDDRRCNYKISSSFNRTLLSIHPKTVGLPDHFIKTINIEDKYVELFKYYSTHSQSDALEDAMMDGLEDLVEGGFELVLEIYNLNPEGIIEGAWKFIEGLISFGSSGSDYNCNKLRTKYQKEVIKVVNKIRKNFNTSLIELDFKLLCHELQLLLSFYEGNKSFPVRYVYYDDGKNGYKESSLYMQKSIRKFISTLSIDEKYIPRSVDFKQRTWQEEYLEGTIYNYLRNINKENFQAHKNLEKKYLVLNVEYDSILEKINSYYYSDIFCSDVNHYLNQLFEKKKGAYIATIIPSISGFWDFIEPCNNVESNVYRVEDSVFIELKVEGLSTLKYLLTFRSFCNYIKAEKESFYTELFNMIEVFIGNIRDVTNEKYLLKKEFDYEELLTHVRKGSEIYKTITIEIESVGIIRRKFFAAENKFDLIIDNIKNAIEKVEGFMGLKEFMLYIELQKELSKPKIERYSIYNFNNLLEKGIGNSEIAIIDQVIDPSIIDKFRPM